MPNFYKEFPKVDHVYYSNDNKRQTIRLTDLSTKFSLHDTVIKSADAFYPYNWRDKDRSDIVADKYYGSVDFYWLIFLSNQLFDPYYDLPLSSRVFENYIYKKYTDDAVATGDYEATFSDVLSYTHSTVHHYVDGDNDIIDLETYQNNINDEGRRIISIHIYENEINEKKRELQLIGRQFSRQIQSELEKKKRNS